MLLSACRTAHKATKEVTVTQTCETSRTSVSVDSSFCSLLGALSLRADSIVLWLEPGETGSHSTTASEERYARLREMAYRSMNSDSTAQFIDSTIPYAKPSNGNGRKVSRLLIKGLQVEKKELRQKAAVSFSKDTLDLITARDSVMTSSEQRRPKGNVALGYIIECILIIFLILLLALLIKQLMPLFKSKEQ